MQNAKIQIPANLEVPFATPGGYGLKGLRYKNFNIDSMLTPGANIRYFDGKSATTWTLLKFNIFRILLNIAYTAIEYYRRVRPGIRDSVHNGIKQIGWVFYGEANHRDVKKKKNNEKVVTFRHVMNKQQQPGGTSSIDKTVNEIEEMIENTASSSSFLIGLPWIMMVNISALQVVISSAWSFVFGRITRRFQRRSRSFTPLHQLQQRRAVAESVNTPANEVQDWAKWNKWIHDVNAYFPSSIGVSFEYEEFTKQAPVAKPTNRQTVTGETVTPSFEALEKYEEIISGYRQERADHEEYQMNKLLNDAAKFVIGSALAKVRKLTMFEEKGKIATSIYRLGSLVRTIREVKSPKPRAIVIHRYVEEVDETGEQTIKEEVLRIDTGNETIEGEEAGLHASSRDVLDVHLITKRANMNSIVACAKALCEHVSNGRIDVEDITDEKVSAVVRKVLLGTSNKVDLFITAPGKHSSLGFPAYGLNNAYI